MSKEERAIYDKAYREKNRDKILQREKEYREKNKDKIKEYNKEYREKNKEKLKQKNKEYSQTEAGIKSMRIKNWKRIGVTLQFHQDWDSIYRTYIECEYCDECEIKFKNSKDRQLDHCHETGYIRNIVCNRCNSLRRYEDAKNLIL